MGRKLLRLRKVRIINMQQGWRSGESARLPPMRPGFDSRTRRHMWVEFVVGSLLCSERFFSGYSGFPLSSKTNISKFQFDRGLHGHFKRVLVNSWCSVGKQITFTLFFGLTGRSVYLIVPFDTLLQNIWGVWSSNATYFEESLSSQNTQGETTRA